MGSQRMRTGIPAVVAAVIIAAGCASSTNDAVTSDCSSATAPCADLSPIDRKYAARSPRLYADVVRARELLLSWHGKDQNLRDAAALLENVLRKDKEFAPAYLELGRLFNKAGYIIGTDYDPEMVNKAIASILKAIEIEPDYSDAFLSLSIAYIDTKRYDDARKALLEAEAIGADKARVEVTWATILLREGQQDAALQRYERLVEWLDPNHRAYAPAMGAMARVYRDQGRYDEAKVAHERKLEAEPDNAWNWGNYASFLLFHYNDVDGAIVNGREALSRMNYGSARFTLACALYTKWALTLDEPDKANVAQDLFDEAWKLYPNLEEVIQTTRKYESTKVAATELARRVKRVP